MRIDKINLLCTLAIVIAHTCNLIESERALVSLVAITAITAISTQIKLSVYLEKYKK